MEDHSVDFQQKYLKYKTKYTILSNSISKSFKMTGGNGNKVDIMLFKAEWCGWCKKFEPVWNALQDKYNKKFNFIKYDLDKDKSVFEKYKIEGFPTVLYKVDKEMVPYNGERDVESFESFLSSI
jgi:thiol-disulfide isomerase/thioredoxin